MINANLQDAKKMKGVLSKESPKLFGGYQARFFQILEADNEEGDGHVLAYFEKEGGQLKGAIPFNEIGDIISINKKEFSFMMNDRIFKLKAENENVKNAWIEALQTVKEHDKKLNTRSRACTKEEPKSWKIQNQSKEVVEAISKQGISINKDSDLSEKLLDIKGLKKQLRGVNPELLKTRLKHGFLLKKHKYTQKRWFFIVSARPLSLKNQILDDVTLDESSLPSSIKFDTLYYFSADDKDTSGAKGEIMLGQSSKIELRPDEEGGFFFIIDMNDRIYEFGSDQSWERDSWYDSLINSRQTSKDVLASITKRPRCIISLVKFYELEGASKIEKIAESESQLLLKDFNEIKDLQVLNILIKKLDSKLIPTLDGCLIFTPAQNEIMKIYAQVFNNSILQKASNYWKYLSENLSVSDLYNIHFRHFSCLSLLKLFI